MNRCPKTADDGRYLCGLEPGHDGPHQDHFCRLVWDDAQGDKQCTDTYDGIQCVLHEGHDLPHTDDDRSKWFHTQPAWEMKLARIERRINDLARQVQGLSLPDNESTYTDEDGKTWSTPTAFAYARACKALRARHESIKKLRAVWRVLAKDGVPVSRLPCWVWPGIKHPDLGYWSSGRWYHMNGQPLSYEPTHYMVVHMPDPPKP